MNAQYGLSRFASLGLRTVIGEPRIADLIKWIAEQSVPDGRWVEAIRRATRFSVPLSAVLAAAFFALEAVVPDQRSAAAAMLDGVGTGAAMVVIASGAALGAYRAIRGLVHGAHGTLARGLGRLVATAAVVGVAGALGLLRGRTTLWRSINGLL